MRFLASLSICIGVLLSPLSVLAFDQVSVFEKSQAKYKVLLFLSFNCPCSKSHGDHLKDLQKKYSQVDFFAVITDIWSEDTKAGINAYFTKERFDFPIIKDDSQKLVKEFGALKTPHAIILERQPAGTYRLLYQGGVTDTKDFADSKIHFLSENLAALAQDKPVKYSEGKCLGCYIRRL